MKILFVVPYPPSRIRSRSYGFIQSLQREHVVTILSQVMTQQEWKDVEILREQKYEVVTVAESKHQSLFRSGIGLLGSYPIQAAYARSSRFLYEAQMLCTKRKFDVIHIEHLRGIASMEPLLKEYPVLWDAVDCLSLLWKQVEILGSSKAMKIFSGLEYVRTEKYEAHLLNRPISISTISGVDRDALLALLPKMYPKSENVNRVIEVLPNGIDTNYFSPAQEKYRPYNVVFSGKMSYHANVAAAHYLYHHIMPLIWKKQPAATLTIVGSKPPKSIRDLCSDSRVEVTGYVDDIRSYIRRAHVMISPMVYSVGMQNKVIESMALGTPAVISSQSAKAIDAKIDRDMFVAASANDFAHKALTIMENSSLRTDLSVQGRRYVEQYHNWQVITKRLIALYQRSTETNSKVLC